MASLSELAIAYHSECGKVIEEEFFKGERTHQIPNLISLGKEWERKILDKLGAISYNNILNATNAPNFKKSLDKNLSSRGEVYIKNLKVDLSSIKNSLNLSKGKNFLNKLNNNAIIDLIKVYKAKGKIIIEVYEIKYSGNIKEYQLFQAGFYVYVLKNLLKNVKDLEVKDTVKILYKKLEGNFLNYGIFEKKVADFEQYLNASFSNIEDIYNKRNLVLFLNPLCALRRCIFFRCCYIRSLTNRGISLFKSLKKEHRGLFYSYGVDTISKMKLSNFKGLKVYKRAYFIEKWLTRKYGFWDYREQSVNDLKIVKIGEQDKFIDYLKNVNLAYIDLIQGPLEPWAIVLVLLLKKDDAKDLVKRYEYTKINNKYLLAFLFNLNGSLSTFSGRKFKEILESLKDKELTIIYLNEETFLQLKQLINEEIELYREEDNFSEIRKTLELKSLISGADKHYAVANKKDIIILENELIYLYMTNESYSYKLPSLYRINRCYDKNLGNYEVKINVFPAPYMNRSINVSSKLIDNLLSTAYSPVLPYNLTLLYKIVEKWEGRYIKKLEDFAVITGTEAVLMFG